MRDASRGYHKIVTGQAGEHHQVDATYRSELKALFEVQFTRFDAKLEQRLAESDTKWERRVAELKTSLILWMFGFWTAATFIILGTTLAILKL